MENLKLHDTISYYRKQMNLTQEALAQKLGVTNQSVSKWESAQCYPDISLIPQLAEIFKISIDELFGKEPTPFVLNGLSPLRDDVRVVVFSGNKIVDCKDINQSIDIRFPKNCNESTKQYFKVSVFGNMSCDASINGDVVGYGNIECNQINGSVNCQNNLTCGQNITGNVNCGNNVTCGMNIQGDINCGNNIECKKIEGDVECHGNIIHKQA